MPRVKEGKKTCSQVPPIQSQCRVSYTAQHKRSLETAIPPQDLFQAKRAEILNFNQNQNLPNLFSKTVDSGHELRLEIAEVDWVQSCGKFVQASQNCQACRLCFCVSSDVWAEPGGQKLGKQEQNPSTNLFPL